MISSNSRKLHLLSKLYNRELYGQFKKGKQPIEPTRQLFSTIPTRLIFPLKSTIPNIGNHILMGATNCGRYLITYAFKLEPYNDLPPRFCYRLYFWSFIPGGKAKLVGEVKLFDNSIVIDMLTIKIIQWPNVMNRLIIFGSCNGEGDLVTRGTTESEEEVDHSLLYITIATTPCLNCQDCASVVPSSQDEDDGIVGKNCSRHGLTIHTWFTVPNQFEFNPNISCSNEHQVVINIGSLIHVLEFSESNSKGVHKEDSYFLGASKTSPSSNRNHMFQDIRCYSRPKNKTVYRPIVNAHLVNRLSYSFLQNNSYMIILSDSWVNKMIYLLVKWINLGNQVEIKDLPYYLKFAIQKNSEDIRSLNVGNVNVSQILLHSENIMQTLFDPCLEQRPKWFSSDKTNRISFSSKKEANEPPDKVYDFKEDIQSCAKFNTFRRLCLANKVYDFDSDEEKNLENIPSNIDGARKRSKHAGNKRSSKEEARDVAIGRFVSGLTRENAKIRKRHKRPQIPLSDWMGPRFEITEEVISAMDEGFGHQPVPLNSTYSSKTFVDIEGNSEILCSMADEDDETDMSMPLCIRGAGYNVMGRVSPDKADKLDIWNVRVTQSSLDVEGVCSLAAEMVCKAEKFKFKHIIDYDTQIVQVCPLTGDILLLVCIQLSADNLSCRTRDNNIKTEFDFRYSRRRMYECQVLSIWSPKTKKCFLEGYSGITEVTSLSEKQRTWAGRREAWRLRPLVKSTFGVQSKGVRTLVHRATDGLLFSSTLILDQDNLIGFKKT